MSTPPIDYTARDFASIKAALLVHIKTKFPDTWRDLYESGAGIAWLELVAYCVTGDTEIPLLDGTIIPIKDLVGRDPFWVYSVDDEKNVVPSLATAKMTRKNAELVEVALDNGKTVRCTPNHLWMMRDGSYKPACELEPGDSLMPLYRRTNSYGYELVRNPKTGSWRAVHRLFAPPPVSEVVHHLNFDKRDNRPENLVWCTKSRHQGFYHLGQDSDYKKRWHRSLVAAQPKHAESIRGEKNPNYGNNWSNDLRERMSKQRRAFFQTEAGKKARKKISESRSGRPMPEETRRKISLSTKGVAKPVGFGEKIRQAKLGVPRSEETKRKLSKAHVGLWAGEKNPKYRADIATSEIVLLSDEFGFSWPKIGEALGCSYQTARLRYNGTFNHKVLSVRNLSHREDVYDLTIIDGSPNFAVGSGVVLHNCFDCLSFYLDYQANECLSGDTEIALANGESVSIEDLVGRENVWVYACDPNTLRVVPARAFAYLRRKNADLVEVVLDNGEVVRCTPDHLWMMRDGSFREASKLSSGDSLMPLYRKESTKGIVGYELVMDPRDEAYHFTHRRFVPGEKHGRGWVIHHKDWNKKNNDPNNLVWLEKASHQSLHARNITEKTRRKMALSQKGRKHTRQTKKKIAEAQHLRFEDPSERERVSQRVKAYWKKVHSGDVTPPVLSDASRRKMGSPFRGKKRPKHAQKMKGNSFALGNEHTAETKKIISESLKGKRKPFGFGKKVSLALLGRKKTVEHRRALSVAMAGKSVMEKHPNFRHDIESTNVRRLHDQEGIPFVRIAESLGCNEATVRRRYCGVNHKVISVKRLYEKEDVYDLSVEKHHNFALSAGVFVHNCYLPTARDRDSVLNLGKLVGYRMRTATSASVTVRGTITVAQASDLIIDAGTEVTTAKGVVFRTVDAQRLPAGDLTADLVFTEGQQYTDTFISDGSDFQKVKLTRSGVIYASDAVTVGGEDWELEDSLVYGGTDSKIYTIEYDDEDYAYVQFGDNSSGAVPAVGATILITYRIGGGVQGNVALGEINTSILGYLDGVLPVTNVSIALLNVQRGSGGEERETTTHARYWIPKWVTTNGRAVTLDDFDTLANTFADATYGTVAYAKARLKQVIPELNTVVLAVWGRDGGGDITTASTGLKAALSTYFNNNGTGSVRIVCTDLETEDGVNVYIDVSAYLNIGSQYVSAEVVDDVTDAIDAFFDDSSEVLPGKDFRISHLYDNLQGVAGVNYSIVNSITASKKTTETIGLGNAVDTTFIATLDLEPNLPVVPYSVVVTAGVVVLTDDGSGLLTGAGTGTVDYDTGIVIANYTVAPDAGENVYCEYRHIIDYQRGDAEATGNGVQTRFQGNVTYPPIVEYDSVTGQKGIAFTDGYQVVRDDGSGDLIGDVNPAGVNRLDYDTGSYDFTFVLPPGNGETIYSTYRQKLQTPSEDIPIADDELPVKGRYTITTAIGE